MKSSVAYLLLAMFLGVFAYAAREEGTVETSGQQTGTAVSPTTGAPEKPKGSVMLQNQQQGPPDLNLAKPDTPAIVQMSEALVRGACPSCAFAQADDEWCSSISESCITPPKSTARSTEGAPANAPE